MIVLLLRSRHRRLPMTSSQPDTRRNFCDRPVADFRKAQMTPKQSARSQGGEKIGLRHSFPGPSTPYFPYGHIEKSFLS
jgi:hypothetical protein